MAIAKSRAAFFRKVELYSLIEEGRRVWPDYQRYAQKRWSAYERTHIHPVDDIIHGGHGADRGGFFKRYHLRMCRWFASQ